MKNLMKMLLIGVAALGLSVSAMAGVSDAGAYLGVAQTFAGTTDSYIGYTFGNVAQTSAFTVQFDVNDLFAGSAFLVNSTLGFGLLYEYDVAALDFEVYANTLLNDGNTNFAEWDAGARAEFLVLPNPCDEVGPCYNPELMVFAEVGITQLRYQTPVIWGEVGFEVHL